MTTTSSAANRSARAGSDGEVLQSLRRIEERLVAIEAAAEPARHIPDGVGMVADIFDDWAMGAAERGVDVDARARRVARLLERLTEPETLALVESVVERREQLAASLELLDKLPDAVAMATDIFDDTVGRLQARGIDPVELTERFSQAAVRFAEFVQSREYQALVESGVFAPQTVQVIAGVGEAMTEAFNADVHEHGFFGVLGAMREAPVQRAVGFGLGFARRFGKLLRRRLPA
ncbi:MAG: DUF1641 domain-containing protein [Persicimonas sp.]